MNALRIATISISTAALLLLVIGCSEPTPEPTPQPTATPGPTATPRPTSTPRPTATPMPEYSSEDLRRFLALKNLCGDGDYQAWNRANIWLQDRDKFEYKLLNGVYGKHDDRTAQYSIDNRKLNREFWGAISELERVCLS